VSTDRHDRIHFGIYFIKNIFEQANTTQIISNFFTQVYIMRIYLYILAIYVCVCVYIDDQLYTCALNNRVAVRVDAEKRRVNIVVVSFSLWFILFFFPDTRPANVVHSNDMIRYASHDSYTHRHTHMHVLAAHVT
jgi:hypothetical protein